MAEVILCKEEAGSPTEVKMHYKFPCAVDCYFLEARDGMPPHPVDDPVSTAVVHSEEELEKAKKDLAERYPGSWVMERPLDTM